GTGTGRGGSNSPPRGRAPAADLPPPPGDMPARRTDPLRPDESLILRKPAGQVAHEGGPRFAVASTEYRLLRRWIADDCRDDRSDLPRLTKLEVTPSEQILVDPADRVKITAPGHFSDGSVRGLTHLATFETTAAGVVDIAPDGTVTKLRDGELNVIVRYLDRQVPVTLAFLPARKDFRWQELPLTNPVDKLVFAQLRALRLKPSPLSDDAMFLRRAYLHPIGIPPTAEEAKEVLD